MTKLLILDFDGTLGDTRANILFTMQQTMRQMGYPVAGEKEIAATIGLPLEEGFAKLYPGISEQEVLTCATLYREIFDNYRKKLIPSLFPYVKETLSTLKGEGYVLSIASSRHSDSLNVFLKDMGIAPFISYVLGANNVTRAKPHPEPVLLTLDALGFRADETLVVGDMPVDIQMGKSAGAKTCAVTYGNASREELEESGADYVIDRFDDILEILCKVNII